MKKILLFSFSLVSFLSLSAHLPDLIPYRKGDLWGYCDSTKKIIIPCRFDQAKPFVNKDSASVVLENKNGWVMRNGDFHEEVPLVQLGYPWMITYPGNLYFVLLNVPKPKFNVYQDTATFLYGYKDRDGKKILLPAVYKSASGFSEGLAAVKLSDESMQYIDEKGKVVISFTNYEEEGEGFQKGRAIVHANGYGLINKKGEYLIPPVFAQLEIIGNYYLASSYGEYENCVLFDSNGKMIGKHVYTSISTGSENLCLAQYDERFCYLNADGKEMTPLKYYSAHDFMGRLAAVSDSTSRWGFINETGKEIVPCKYAETGDFVNGFASVLDSNGHWGFINESGKEIIPCQYDRVYAFSKGMAAVISPQGQWGFIDGTGKTVIPLKYKEPVADGFTENGLCEISETGYIDLYGTEYWED